MAHAEVNVTSLRRAKIPQLGKLNKEMMLDALDEIVERRDQEILSIQNYQHLAESYYNMKVRARPLELDDLVLRKESRCLSARDIVWRTRAEDIELHDPQAFLQPKAFLLVKKITTNGLILFGGM